jgi:hypothetical protein
LAAAGRYRPPDFAHYIIMEMAALTVASLPQSGRLVSSLVKPSNSIQAIGGSLVLLVGSLPDGRYFGPGRSPSRSTPSRGLFWTAIGFFVVVMAATGVMMTSR